MTKTKIRCSSMNHIVGNLLRNKYQQKVRQITINKKIYIYIYKPTDKQVKNLSSSVQVFIDRTFLLCFQVWGFILLGKNFIKDIILS